MNDQACFYFCSLCWYGSLWMTVRMLLQCEVKGTQYLLCIKKTKVNKAALYRHPKEKILASGVLKKGVHLVNNKCYLLMVPRSSFGNC